MSEEIRHINPQGDSEKKRTEILEFLFENNEPQSLAKIADIIQSSEQEAEHHLDVLGEKGLTDFIRRDKVWGFVLKSS